MITFDMDKAKNLKKQEIRLEREEHFKKLDLDFMRAVEDHDTEKQEEIRLKKVALRDATDDPAIEAATDIEELKAVRPAALDNV